MLRRVVDPNHLPVSIEEVKAHLRLDSQAEDDYLQELIKAATNSVESYLGRSLLKQTWSITQTTQEPLVRIKLPNPPLMEIISVKSIHSNVKQTEIKRFILARGGAVPEIEVITESKGVEIVYSAGYGDQPKHVPDAIRQAILMLIAELYLNRESGNSKAEGLWKTLLQPFKIWRLA